MAFGTDELRWFQREGGTMMEWEEVKARLEEAIRDSCPGTRDVSIMWAPNTRTADLIAALQRVAELEEEIEAAYKLSSEQRRRAEAAERILKLSDVGGGGEMRATGDHYLDAKMIRELFQRVEELEQTKRKFSEVQEGLFRRAEAAEARVGELERALRGLTPGGSEFLTIEECVSYVRDQRSGMLSTVKVFKQRADAAEAKLARCVEVLEEVVGKGGE